MNPVLDAATKRALMGAIILGLLTFFAIMVQTDDWKMIVSVVGTATLTNFAVRAGIEGIYDTQRAINGDVSKGDVPGVVAVVTGDDLSDHVVERHSEFFSAADDVVAVHGPGECLIFHFLFYRAHIDILNTFCGANECYCYDEAA